MVNKRTPPADQGRAKKEADHSLWRYICTLLNDDFASIGQVERHTGLSHTSNLSTNYNRDEKSRPRRTVYG